MQWRQFVTTVILDWTLFSECERATITLRPWGKENLWKFIGRKTRQKVHSFVKEGFYMKSSQETGSAKDILLLFRHHCETSYIWNFASRKHFDPRQDLFFFLATLVLLSLGHYIGGYSEILTGFCKTLTFSVISDEHAGHALTNLHSTTLSSLQELAFPTFLCQSSLLTCVDDTSAKTILIIR